jgi:hypothetical protein
MTRASRRKKFAMQEGQSSGSEGPPASVPKPPSLQDVTSMEGSTSPPAVKHPSERYSRVSNLPFACVAVRRLTPVASRKLVWMVFPRSAAKRCECAWRVLRDLVDPCSPQLFCVRQ